MKSIRVRSVLPAVLLVAAPAVAAERSANPAWEKLRALAGEWEGTVTHEGKPMPVSVSYTLVSSGHALMERLSTPDGADMVTMYHPDGSRIMLTHYCAGGNQPRMRAEFPVGEPQSLAFDFIDATNLASPKDEHMRKLVVRFQGPDHFTQEWTHRKDGKEETGVFTYKRKK